MPYANIQLKMKKNKIQCLSHKLEQNWLKLKKKQFSDKACLGTFILH